MAALIWGTLVVLGFSGLSYLYGCFVGIQHGKRVGRARADAEWARWAEHGAL